MGERVCDAGRRGLDVSLKHHLLVRAVQVDYQLTRVPNGSTDSQNSFRVTTGLVYRFGMR